MGTIRILGTEWVPSTRSRRASAKYEKQFQPQRDTTLSSTSSQRSSSFKIHKINLATVKKNTHFLNTN